jgi:DNA polymerase-3 subunit beta
MTVMARSEDIGAVVSEIDATIEGPGVKIAFDDRYLTDVLAVLVEPRVALETTGPSGPGVIRPVGTEDWVHVIMPLSVKW